MTLDTDSTDSPQVEVEATEPKEKQPSKRPPKKFRVNIYDAWCKQCGICVEFCPKSVFTKDELGAPHATYQEKCIGCTQCVLHCPDFAIAVFEDVEEQDK